MALDSALNKWVDCVPEHRKSPGSPYLFNVIRILCFVLSTLGVGGFEGEQCIPDSIDFPLVSILPNATPRSQNDRPQEPYRSRTVGGFHDHMQECCETMH